MCQCVDLGGRRIIKKIFFEAEDGIRDTRIGLVGSEMCIRDSAQPIHQAQAKMESMQHITERHQAERKALREKQNAERLEVRLMHQKEMESLLQKHKLERRSAIYR